MPTVTIDDYIQVLPGPVRERMTAIRSLVQEVAPEATECIAYAIPSFKVGTNYLVHVGAWKRHIAVYPASREMEELIPGVAERSNGKGTVQFRHNLDLPMDTIRAMLEHRLGDCRRAFER